MFRALLDKMSLLVLLSNLGNQFSMDCLRDRKGLGRTRHAHLKWTVGRSFVGWLVPPFYADPCRHNISSDFWLMVSLAIPVVAYLNIESYTIYCNLILKTT